MRRVSYSVFKWFVKGLLFFFFSIKGILSKWYIKGKRLDFWAKARRKTLSSTRVPTPHLNMHHVVVDLVLLIHVCTCIPFLSVSKPIAFALS